MGIGKKMSDEEYEGWNEIHAWRHGPVNAPEAVVLALLGVHHQIPQHFLQRSGRAARVSKARS